MKREIVVGSVAGCMCLGLAAHCLRSILPLPVRLIKRLRVGRLLRPIF